MKNVRVRFATRWPWNPVSLAIARLGGSPSWSHVMLIIDDVAYESTILHGSRAVDVSVAMQGIVKYQDMLVPVPDIKAAMVFGRAQIGKPYDFAGAFGIPLLKSEDWADDTKWWCSEQVFMQLGAGGTWLLDPAVYKRVTQNHLWLCNFPKTIPLHYAQSKL